MQAALIVPPVSPPFYEGPLVDVRGFSASVILPSAWFAGALFLRALNDVWRRTSLLVARVTDGCDVPG